MRRRVHRCLFALAVLFGGAAPAAGQLPFNLDTLRVSVGSRLADEVGAVEVISAADLARLPVRTVEEALRWSLGVDLQARSPAQADLSIRGSSFEQVLVLVDGVRMSDPQTGHFDLDLTVPLDRVERIEILRGPASALYGADAVGGVVHVVTRDGRGLTEPRGIARVEKGSFGSWGWGLGGTAPAGSWRVGGGVSQDVGDGHREGTDYRILRGSTRLAGPVGEGWAVLDLGHARRDFGATGFYAPFSSWEETRTTTASLRWVGRTDGGVVLEPRISFRGHDDDFVLQRDDPGLYRNLHDSRQVSAELQTRLPLGSSGALALGGEWSRESLESTNLGDREQDWRALFGEVAWSGRSLDLQIGARLDDRDDVGSVFSPTASLRVHAGEGLTLRMAGGRSFRAPTWTDRFYTDPANVGRPDLEMERGWSAEMGARFRSEPLVLSATAFRRETRDLIDWARPLGADETVPWETRNVEEARFTGLELAAEEIRVGDAWVRAAASWIRLETEEEAGFFSKSALRPVVRELTLGIRAPLPDDSSINVLLADRTRRGGAGAPVVDVRLEIPMGNGHLYMDARNLTDRDHLDVTGFSIPGRAFTVGIRSPFSG